MLLAPFNTLLRWTSRSRNRGSSTFFEEPYGLHSSVSCCARQAASSCLAPLLVGWICALLCSTSSSSSSSTSTTIWNERPQLMSQSIRGSAGRPPPPTPTLLTSHCTLYFVHFVQFKIYHQLNRHDNVRKVCSDKINKIIIWHFSWTR